MMPDSSSIVTPRGFSIRFFIPSGTPDGMRIVEKSNWIGRAIVCPRGAFQDLKQRPEFKKTGVYILVGNTTPDDPPTIYIGEGDPVGDRLAQHQKTKDFWTTVVFFTSKDDNLNKAHVQYLEAKLVARALDAKRCRLDNGNAPTLPSLSEADIADMEEFLVQMLLIYPVIGVNVFQRPEAAAAHVSVLHAKAKGLSARGYETSDGFVVLAGSESPKEHVESTNDYVVAIRKHLLEQGLFADAGDRLRLVQDYTFSSPSAAAAVMLARTANGRIEWKDDQGRPLKDLQAAAAGAGA
jgi:hypothetical protein